MEPIIISLLGTTASAHTFFHRSSSSSFGVSSFNRHNNSPRKAIEFRVPAARDRVIDFGKHKGKLLGTVSSEYLKWMSKNLTCGDYEKWGKLAEDVLEDEVYADRMEWEVAETLLSGNREGVVASGCGVARELEEISKKFGWDYHDQAGWSKVDFGLLGTSKGGRLPRRVEVQVEKKSSNFKEPRCCSSSRGGGGERERRRERAAKKREQQIQIGGRRRNEEEDDNERKQQEDDKGTGTIFPGREYVINKLKLRI